MIGLNNTSVLSNNFSRNNGTGAYLEGVIGTNFSANQMLGNNRSGIVLGSDLLATLFFPSVGGIPPPPTPSLDNTFFNNTILSSGFDPSPFPLTDEVTSPFTGLPLGPASPPFHSGIGIFSSDNDTVVLNNISGSNESGIFGDGIVRTSARQNNATNNNAEGIILRPSTVLPVIFGSPSRPSSGNLLSRNNASNNTVGIFVNNSTDNRLESNNASFNTEDGIRLQDAPNNSLSNNTARNNSRFGIYINRSNNIASTGDDARFNLHGIFYNGTVNNTVRNGVFNNSGEDGVRLENTDMSLVEFNTIQDNLHGAHVKSSTNFDVANNLFNNSEFNILIEPSLSSRLFRIVGNLFLGRFGINITSGMDGDIISNQFRFNEIAIDLRSSSNVSIRDSIIQDSEVFDFSFLDSTGRVVNTTFDPCKVRLVNSTIEGIPSVVSVAANVDIDPDTLNAKSKGQFMTAYIEIPGQNVSEVNISSVRLETVPAISDPKFGFVKNPEVVDRDGNGFPEIAVKFGRQAAIEVLPAGTVTANVTGRVGLACFKGSDTIRVLK